MTGLLRSRSQRRCNITNKVAVVGWEKRQRFPPKNTTFYNTAISKINIAEIIELIPTNFQKGVIPPF